MMKTKISCAALSLCLLLAAEGAFAHGRAHIDFHVGPFWSPWWIVPSLFYSRPVVVEREAPLVIEQTEPPPSYWFYCRSSNAYYPYVKECTEAWEKVPAQPAGQ